MLVNKNKKLEKKSYTSVQTEKQKIPLAETKPKILYVDLEKKIEKLERENLRLSHILETSALLSSDLVLERVIDDLLEKAKLLCGAENSSVMLLDKKTQELYFYAIHNFLFQEINNDLLNLRLRLGEGITGWVAKHAKAVLVEDCSKDLRFSKRADEKTSYQTRSMMCVPLKFKDRVLGTIQIVNRIDHTFFDEADLNILELLANQAAVAIESARLHEMATIDATTKLYMKDYFLARLEEEYNEAKIKNKPISLLMSDIDFFKKVNDKFGHQGGDIALIELASVIRESMRDLGRDVMVGRYGGEEFCVLLPNKDEKETFEIGELIRKNIEAHPIPINGKTENITISIGYTTYPKHKDYLKSSLDMIKFADEALYTCKKRGRNCVSAYEPAHNKEE